MPTKVSNMSSKDFWHRGCHFDHTFWYLELRDKSHSISWWFYQLLFELERAEWVLGVHWPADPLLRPRAGAGICVCSLQG